LATILTIYFIVKIIDTLLESVGNRISICVCISLFVVSFVVSISAVDFLERLVSEVIYYV